MDMPLTLELFIGLTTDVKDTYLGLPCFKCRGSSSSNSLPEKVSSSFPFKAFLAVAYALLSVLGADL